MSGWSWKQAVAERALEVVNASGTARFTIQDVYDRQDVLQQRFPNNRHVRERIRETLQELRDAKFLDFLGRGEYQLNLKFPELDWQAAPQGELGVEVPGTRLVARTIRLRNTFLAADMKKRYDNSCQVCRIKLQLTRCTYAESHHMKPIGAPHFGPDTEGNILVVCPNHHIMLDRGAVRIDPCSLLVEHITGSFAPCPLLVHPRHVLNRSYLRYHAEEIYGKY
jgi:predicted restriction endonuclease